jgi:hypothetical protein
MFGPDLLAAPVLGPGVTERELYLPPGRWIEFWDGVSYQERGGDLALDRARLVRGDRTRTVPAPLDELPLMIRAGALLPMLPADVDTLADRYDARGLVSLRDRERRLELLAFPRGRSAARLYENERLLSSERRGGWRLEIRGEVRRRWRIDASLATLRDPFRPRCVKLNGRRLPGGRWSYSKRERRLHVNVRATRARIDVRAHC